MNQLSESEKSWLAGFIDGEGYIGTTFQRKKETKCSAASPRYHPYLIITNTNKEILLYINKIIGDGRLYLLNKKNENLGKWKVGYQYKLTKKETLLQILEYILPYLKVKDKQCKILIDFIKRRDDIKIITGRGSRGITSYNQDDEEIHKSILLLNKKGRQ